MDKKDLCLSLFIGIVNAFIFFLLLKRFNLGIPYLEWSSMAIPFLVLGGIYLADFLGRKWKIIFQASKFFLVGTLNTFIDLGVLEVLTWLSGIEKGYGVTFFKAISFLVATTNSYFWNKHWTFGKKEKMVAVGEYFRFVLVTAIGLSINALSFHFVFNVIGPQFSLALALWRLFSVIVAAFCAFVWNFLASKFLVFEKKK